MKKNNDLQIKIKLSPIQLNYIPQIVNQINDQGEMLMNQVAIKKNFLEINCHDLYELFSELASANLEKLEIVRLKKQAREALEKIINSDSITLHRKKNFISSLDLVSKI